MTLSANKQALLDAFNRHVNAEHIYWDQASVLMQSGLLDPESLAVAGIEAAYKMEALKQRYSQQ